jgi:hypothetical protein
MEDLMRISHKTALRTADVMRSEWSQHIRSTGDLTPEDMTKSLRRRYNEYRDVSVPTVSSVSLQMINEAFIAG